MTKQHDPSLPIRQESTSKQADLARRFLNACARIEQTLAGKYEIDGKGFGDLVRKTESRDAVVRRNARTLRKYVELRNFISHTEWRDNEPIASPLPETVEEIERLAGQIDTPVQALTLAVRNPMTAVSTDPLKDRLSEMAKDDISQVPVYGGENEVRLLTTNAIARWLASHIEDDGNVLVEGGTLEEALVFSESHEKIEFVKRTSSAAAALDRLTKVSPPAVVLITENGIFTESPLGILVAADIPKLVEAVTVSYD